MGHPWGWPYETSSHLLLRDLAPPFGWASVSLFVLKSERNGQATQLLAVAEALRECSGTVGWARTTDLLFHSKSSPELHDTRRHTLRQINIQVNHILSAYSALVALHFVLVNLTSFGTFLEPFGKACYAEAYSTLERENGWMPCVRVAMKSSNWVTVSCPLACAHQSGWPVLVAQHS